MPQLNGLQLLQWIRTNKDGPNRYCPLHHDFQCCGPRTGACGTGHGANEFIAKPFSISSILSRLQAVIDRPRQYVATRSFFGPCRRRIYKDLPKDVAKDRRRAGESHATIVYSAKDVKRQPEGSDVYLFKFPNLLKQKIGLENMKVPFEMPKEILAEAEETLEREAEGFLDWPNNISMSYRRKFLKPLKIKANRSDHLAEVNRIAHALHGQGGMFGYPLITLFAKSLY